MSDLKEARTLFEAAERDLLALRGMRDADVFADEIFGFHVQQAELEISRLGLWAQIVIGIVQCVLIAGGLWIMRMAAITRDNQHEEAKDRHEETMLALRALIERTTSPANDG